MIILGLTGSIGMGKSTTAAMLRCLGIPVHDADRTVHALLGRGGGAVAAIADAFGRELVSDGAIDRCQLGAAVFRDSHALRRLEAILHPLVRHAERHFLANAARRRAPLVALDVPLLFETGGDRRVDATLVVTAPAFVQRVRVLARPGMTTDKLEGILQRQLSDAEKRRRADFLVHTGLGKYPAFRTLKRLIALTAGWRGRHWPPSRDRNSAVLVPLRRLRTPHA